MRECENVKSNPIECKEKQTVAVEIQESLAELGALADKVEAFCYSKLAPITLEKEENNNTCISETGIGSPYPPLFAEYRNKIQVIEISLLHIEEMLQAAEI